ncbi:heterokaryon incompatibility protein-domain-containing protein [Triangularia setosa]|uniref:Heterokaryon incompatibility protein-domain-containing protein n=1 Tax=Triangularia setosa TaxID=2587417 RepID=A0AAN7A4I4_9PEZI|nr:heterokaryon incompatibility protein-domain-containing protein [Podospora setosa]
MNDINGKPDDGQAVTYGKATDEWKILHEELTIPELRARRADAHRPSPRDAMIKGAQKHNVKFKFPLTQEQQFKYSKLNDGEIRILRLYKSKDWEEPLKADLFKRQLNSPDVNGRYEALSYCWGTDSPTHIIQVRDLNAAAPGNATADQTKSKTKTTSNIMGLWNIAVGAITHTDFKIRENLYNALKRLRSRYRDVYLWVDAICIDQSERGKAEKQGQLAMMASIYNSASNVCVWLGEDAFGAQRAFDLVKKIMDFKSFDEIVDDRNPEVAWAELVSIMKANWFSRRWIIQEIALSREASIHCGRHSIHWDDFADAISLLMEKVDIMRSKFGHDLFEDVETSSASILIQTLGNICRKSDDIETRGKISGCLLDIETLVSTLLGFHASYPRDTIYSVLSLAKDIPEEEESDWQELHKKQLRAIREQRLYLVRQDLDILNERKKILETELSEAKTEYDQCIALLEWLAEKQRELGEAVYKHQEDEVKRLVEEIGEVNWEEWEKKKYEYVDRAAKLETHKGRIQKLTQLETSLFDDHSAISLVPNYQFSPRDLFVAFVTRSIKRSDSLDIICRHWAPKLERDDGADELPSWISSLSKAPRGMLGSSQGRQNGENLVSYLPHDQRKRYSASRTEKANIQMHDDPQFFWIEGKGNEDMSKYMPGETHFSAFTMSKEPSIASHDSRISIQELINNMDGFQKGKRVNEEFPIGKLGYSRLDDGGFNTGGGTTSISGPSASSPVETARGRISGPLPSPAPTIGKSWSFYSPGEHSIKDRLGRRFRNLGSNRKEAPPTSSDNTVPENPARQSGHAEKPVPPFSSQNGKGKHPNIDTDRAFSSHRRSTSATGIFAPPARVNTTHPHAADDDEIQLRTAIPPKSISQPHSPRAAPRSKLHNFNRMPVQKSSWDPPHRLSGILVVRGFILGEVIDQSEAMRGGVIPGEWVFRLGWKKNENPENRVPDTLWRLLVADRMPEGGRPPQWYKRACLHGLVDQKVSDDAGNIHTATLNPRKIGELTMRYFKRVESVVWQRRIMELENGFFGLGPEGGQVGHVVCILYGCSVPVLLKKVEDPRVEELYEVVGETYVHGVMDGEAMDFTEHWQPEVREFKLG